MFEVDFVIVCDCVQGIGCRSWVNQIIESMKWIDDYSSGPRYTRHCRCNFLYCNKGWESNRRFWKRYGLLLIMCRCKFTACTRSLNTDECHTEHLAPVLQQLHWLPVQQCIELVYKALNGMSPQFSAGDCWLTTTTGHRWFWLSSVTMWGSVSLHNDLSPLLDHVSETTYLSSYVILN